MSLYNGSLWNLLIFSKQLAQNRTFVNENERKKSNLSDYVLFEPQSNTHVLQMN